jgi:hypothetical protein
VSEPALFYQHPKMGATIELKPLAKMFADLMGASDSFIGAVVVSFTAGGDINVTFSGMRPTEAIGALEVGIDIIKRQIIR